MRKLRQTIPYCFVWIVIFFFSCHDSSIEINLKDSEGNRHELEKLIRHYKGDEMKLEAVKCLLENMDVHGCFANSLQKLFASQKLFITLSSKNIMVI